MIRLDQGAAFESVGDLDNAWRAYMDILEKFPNESSVTPVAAREAGSLLARKGRLAEIVPYLDRLLAKLDNPDVAMLFRANSNYVRVAQYKMAVCAEIGDDAGRLDALDKIQN